MSRKLAYIATVTDIHPIPNKDRIELCLINGGWSVICKKNEYAVGDKTVYVEIDSVLPEKPEFEFMRSKHFRVKTMKMAGVISQGICFPLSILPDGEYEDGQDVTDLIGITQYEPDMDLDPVQECNKRKVRKYPEWLMRYKWFRKLFLPKKENRGFPDFIAKTDECRIQSKPFVLGDKSTRWCVTEKLDGCVSGRTLITTENGQEPISKIVNRGTPIKVLTFNELTGNTEFKDVLEFHRYKADKITYRIGVGFRGRGNRAKFVECTDNHEFFTKRGWLRADELMEDDIIFHNNKNIPFEMKELILGCILGDSSINYNPKHPLSGYKTISFIHSEKQIDYFNYKKQLFGELFKVSKDLISGYGFPMKSGLLQANAGMSQFIHEYCIGQDGKRKVSKKMLDYMSPLSLAIWYMDDGALSHRNSDKQRPRAMLCTNRYTYDEHLLFLDMFREKFNLTPKIGNSNVYNGHVLLFSADDTERLSAIINPYVCDSMKYKLPIKYESMPCYLENVSFDLRDGIVETKVLSIEKCKPNEFGNYVFDLSVQDNHNYFANNILVHNSSFTCFIRKRKNRTLLDRLLEKNKYEFGICSRNLRLWQEDNSNYWSVVRRYNLKELLIHWMETGLFDEDGFIAIQGEILAPGVQRNRYATTEPDLYVFNIIDHYGRWASTDAEALCREHKLKHVPIIETNFTLPDTVDEVLEMAHGKSVLYNTLREGLVFRSADGKHSFKAVDPKWLLKNE